MTKNTKCAAPPPGRVIQKGYSGTGKVSTPLPSGSAGMSSVFYPKGSGGGTSNQGGQGSGPGGAPSR